jgi:hypothetical protein
MIEYDLTYITIPMMPDLTYYNFNSSYNINFRPLYFNGEPSTKEFYQDDVTIQQNDSGVWYIHFPADKDTIKIIPLSISRLNFEDAINEYNLYLTRMNSQILF